jgi:hypothetical protein
MISFFEADYLPMATEGTETVTQDRLRRDFDRSALRGRGITAFRDAGYEVVASAEGFEHISMRAAVDRFLDRPELTDLEMLLLQSTWLLDMPGVPRDWFLEEHRRRIDGIFDDASSVVVEDADHPVFGFFHVPSPHAPIAFGPDGGPVTWGSRQFGAAFADEYGLTQPAFLEAYAAQLAYLHARTLQLVREIRESNSQAAIVVLSDHGTSAEPSSDPQGQLPNLIATHLPDGPLTGAEAATPLSVIRALLGRYTGLDLPTPRPRFWVAHEDDGRIVLQEIRPPE